MNRHLVTLIKIALLTVMIWWVFGTINFRDRILFKENENSDKVVKEQVVSIQGHWNAEPIQFLVQEPTAAATDEVQTANRGKQADGLFLEVAPGIFSYWSNLAPSWFLLGALCYFLTVVIAGIRWWWLLRP